MSRPNLSFKVLLYLGLMLALVGVLAACGGQTAPPPAQPSANEPPPAATEASVEEAAPAESAAEAPAGDMSAMEAPMLASMVESGDLPPLEERLPVNPVVVEPLNELGVYGGVWDQAVTGQADANGAISYSHEPWVTYDDTCSEWVPNLAEAVDISDDGRTFTFTIREGHKWSDGEPFTTEDVMFWYNDIAMNTDISPVPPSIIMAGGEPAVFEALDDYTFSVTFVEPNGLFLPNLAFVFGGDIGKAPAHYLQQFHADYVDAAELDAKVSEAGFEDWTQFRSRTAAAIAQGMLPPIPNFLCCVRGSSRLSARPGSSSATRTTSRSTPKAASCLTSIRSVCKQWKIARW
ncbi:MAG: ABC transporter substrate-binding protein [Caldilineaceae bacterium]